MGRKKTSFKFEKRQREIAKQKKKKEKMERRLSKDPNGSDENDEE